ncbi:hypothetical protein [Pseudonocardia sp. KRD291]|uniref:hypothetical protein n=1 Tax=Pseudonocardia sp. KRD291 TaxID=2792007 RepID=UPI001C4A3416|nr:hypothetical protein [Pseudonocardia sp. KRD291]MBW0103952.1 adenylate cyclase [Pseudonocardia sp. KRD291]
MDAEKKRACRAAACHPWTDLADPALRGRRVRTVELKFLVPEASHEAVLRAPMVDRRNVRLRQVWYFDTPDLVLRESGLILRARRNRRGDDDAVVKLRRPRPVPLPGRVRRSPNLRVELDALPGMSWWSAALGRTLSPAAIRSALRGKRSLSSLFSAEQRGFLRGHAEHRVDLDGLSGLGPIEVARRRTTPRNGGPGLVVEDWTYPDGFRLVEVSARCRIDRVARVATAARNFLTEQGVDPHADQRTKTGVSLERFAGK